jgi:hypothetical protein
MRKHIFETPLILKTYCGDIDMEIGSQIMVSYMHCSVIMLEIHPDWQRK